MSGLLSKRSLTSRQSYNKRQFMLLVLVIMRDILVSKLADSFFLFAIGGNRTYLGIIPLKKQNYAKGYGEVLRIHNLSLC